MIIGGQMTGKRTRIGLRLGAGGLCIIAVAIIAVRASLAQHAPPTQVANPAASLVPAVTTKAARQDVPIYISGLGTVQAYQSVLVRARVDGTLERFPVREGQAVKQG